MNKRIYLDNNATTPLHPQVLEALLPFYRENFGNPSSIHWAGREVKGAVEKARENVAYLVNCDPSEVVFTSSGTEADNMAIKGVAAALRNKGNHIITTAVEHPAVLNTCRHLEAEGFVITRIPVDAYGIPNMAAMEAAISDRTILISAMFANNETGTILPVGEIGALAEQRRIYFHCDGVQAAGKIPIDCRAFNINLLALSAHKIYAPKGIGALVVRKGVKLRPFIHGGSQERNRRAGTENVAGIAAFGTACTLAQEFMSSSAISRIKGLRDKLEHGITTATAGVVLNGHREQRLSNTLNLSFSGVDADSLLMNLDLAGIAASSGSACSSGTLKASPVLAAMGVSPDMAKASIRFSLGAQNDEQEIDYVLHVLPGIVERLRKENKD